MHSSYSYTSQHLRQAAKEKALKMLPRPDIEMAWGKSKRLPLKDFDPRRRESGNASTGNPHVCGQVTVDELYYTC